MRSPQLTDPIGIMLRSGSPGFFARSSVRFLSPSNRYTSSLALGATHRASELYALRLYQPRSLALDFQNPLYRPFTRYASTQPGNSIGHANKAEEKAIGKEHLQAHPAEVTTVSTAHPVFEETKREEPEEEDIDMLAGVKSDFKAIKETFAFEQVPPAALVMGLAGVVPYAVTSLTTLYLAWDVNHYHLLVSDHTAELLLHIIEPLQIGYGAVIISFLGAIHWGFEWSRYGGQNSYARYALGVLAPAIAWPTLLFSIEYALITQFTAFIMLYYADANAVVRGMAPHWYTTYRFVLTFVVGASIVMSLAARGQIADKIHNMPSPADRVKALRDSQLEALEQAEIEERALRAAQKDAEDEDEEDEDGDGDGDEDGDDE